MFHNLDGDPITSMCVSVWVSYTGHFFSSSHVKGTTPSNSVGRESVIKTAKVASVSSVGGRVSVSTTTKEASADPGGSGNVQ